VVVRQARQRDLTDYSQLSGVTVGAINYDLVHAGTDNSERTKLGSTWFHHTALGLASTTTNGVDTGFIREPAGTLKSMTTGGKSYYYLTDGTGNVLGLVDDAGKRTHTYALAALISLWCGWDQVIVMPLYRQWLWALIVGWGLSCRFVSFLVGDQTVSSVLCMVQVQ
jgi:hypothetical protein